LSFPGICPLTLLNSYKSKIDLLACNGRVWRTWNNPLQKFVNSPMGINSIAQIPQKIAKFLNLQNPQQYTGHCFRRSASTFLANQGISLLNLKRFER
jgi:hypothetical protein